MILFTFLILQNPEIKFILVSYTRNMIDFLIKLNRKLNENKIMIFFMNLKDEYLSLSKNVEKSF